MNKVFFSADRFDKKILNILKQGLKFCFYITIFSSILLLIYETFIASPTLFYTGLSLFKSSLFFMVTFIICGIAFSKIKDEVE